jgi:hypothetical protein
LDLKRSLQKPLKAANATTGVAADQQGHQHSSLQQQQSPTLKSQAPPGALAKLLSLHGLCLTVTFTAIWPIALFSVAMGGPENLPEIRLAVLLLKGLPYKL